MKALGRSLTVLLALIALCSVFFAQHNSFSTEDRTSEAELLRKQVSMLDKRVSTLEHRLDEMVKPRMVPLSQ